MTIAETDREVKSVIEKYSVYGLESVLFAVARATAGKSHMDKEYVVTLLEKCYEHIERWGE